MTHDWIFNRAYYLRTSNILMIVRYPLKHCLKVYSVFLLLARKANKHVFAQNLAHPWHSLGSERVKLSPRLLVKEDIVPTACRPGYRFYSARIELLQNHSAVTAAEAVLTYTVFGGRVCCRYRLLLFNIISWKFGPVTSLVWLNPFNAELFPKRATVGDRGPRRWGKWEPMPNATLSPPEWLLH